MFKLIGLSLLLSFSSMSFAADRRDGENCSDFCFRQAYEKWGDSFGSVPGAASAKTCNMLCSDRAVSSLNKEEKQRQDAMDGNDSSSTPAPADTPAPDAPADPN